MTTRVGRAWPIGGMPPIEKPVSSFASRAVARRTSERADDGGQPGEVDAVRARDEGEDRLGTVSPVGHEDQRLHDLAEVRADRRGGLGGGVGRLVEDLHLDGHALAGGGVGDAPDGGMVERVGHGAESSIG